MCKISYKDPWETCSKTITILGIVGTTPMSKAILGCLRMLCITISFWISCNNSSVMFGSKIFLIATGVPLSSPLYIMEKPPWPIFSLKSRSYSVISLTPGTGGRRPALSETSLLHLVKAWKFALWISFFRPSISSTSFFWCFLSFLSCSSNCLTCAFV